MIKVEIKYRNTGETQNLNGVKTISIQEVD